jgi:hypothetical protein
VIIVDLLAYRYLDSLGMTEVWKKWFESHSEYHSTSVARFAWWTEDDFDRLGVEKRIAQYLVAHLAKFKHGSGAAGGSHDQ